MRTAARGDFPIDVDGIGRFTFGRKQMTDIYAIRGEYSAMTASNFAEDGSFADLGALAFVTIGRMMVAAPAGFNMDSIDPLVEENPEEKIVKVFFALREKELSFRPQPKGDGEDAGEAVS